MLGLLPSEKCAASFWVQKLQQNREIFYTLQKKYFGGSQEKFIYSELFLDEGPVEIDQEIWGIVRKDI